MRGRGRARGAERHLLRRGELFRREAHDAQRREASRRVEGGAGARCSTAGLGRSGSAATALVQKSLAWHVLRDLGPAPAHRGGGARAAAGPRASARPKSN